MAAAVRRRRPPPDGSPGRKRLVGAVATLAVGLGFTPLHLLFLYLRGMDRRRNVLACFLENIIAYHLLLLLLREALHAAPAMTRQQQRRQLLVLLLAAAAVFVHAFTVAAQITAVALMGSRMNGDFIYNLVWAVKTNTWGATDAKFFFPSVLSATLAIDMAWLWWGLKLSCSGNGVMPEDEEDDADDKAAHKKKSSAVSGRTSNVKSLCLTLGMVGLLRNVLLWRGYSPVANTVYSLVQYSQMTGPSNLKRSQRRPARKAHKRYNYNYTALPELAAANAAAAETTRLPTSDTEQQQQQKKEGKTNVILIINDSFGNALLKTEEGLKAFPFYEETVQQHPNFYDFTNNRAVSGNTLTAASAALLGAYVAAPDYHPDTWTFFDLPNLFTMGKALGYRLVLFMPYEHEDWFPFTGFYEDRFDKIVSRNTLNGKAVNDMGMDDRLVTAEVLKFLEEEGAKQQRREQRQQQGDGKEKEEEGEDLRPFIVVIFWNNMHTPFLQNPWFERAENQTLSEANVDTETGNVDTERGEEMKDAVVKRALLSDTETETGYGAGAAPAAAAAATAAAVQANQTTTKRKKLVPSEVLAKANFATLATIGIKASRAIQAIEIGNKMTQNVFDKLESTGLLDNTLLSFQSDHGETAGPVVRKRLADPDSLYLATPFWMHVPPHLLSSSEGDILLKNKNKLTSNMDMMPTFVEILKWDTTENLFHNRPSIFKHGQSLLRPVQPDRLTSGWQGRPFVDSCDWAHGFVFNATHTLIIRAGENDALLEAIDEEDGTWTTVKQRWTLKDLPKEEVEWWTRELKTNYPDMMVALKECFWKYL